MNWWARSLWPKLGPLSSQSRRPREVPWDPPSKVLWKRKLMPLTIVSKGGKGPPILRRRRTALSRKRKPNFIPEESTILLSSSATEVLDTKPNRWWWWESPSQNFPWRVPILIRVPFWGTEASGKSPEMLKKGVPFIPPKSRLVLAYITFRLFRVSLFIGVYH